MYLIEIPHQTTTVQKLLRKQAGLYLIEIPHQTTTFPLLRLILFLLYLIEIPHQTTTIQKLLRKQAGLYLIEIPHQTTTKSAAINRINGCILSKFHIKPQHSQCHFVILGVVSYRNSTSNHNGYQIHQKRNDVVSYRNSTSNHNVEAVEGEQGPVVSYRNSTSNHNTRPRRP